MLFPGGGVLKKAFGGTSGALTGKKKPVGPTPAPAAPNPPKGLAGKLQDKMRTAKAR